MYEIGYQKGNKTKESRMTKPGKTAYPQVETTRSRAYKEGLKPVWKWMISGDLQPSRVGEEDAATKRGGCE